MCIHFLCVYCMFVLEKWVAQVAAAINDSNHIDSKVLRIDWDRLRRKYQQKPGAEVIVRVPRELTKPAATGSRMGGVGLAGWGARILYF